MDDMKPILIAVMSVLVVSVLGVCMATAFKDDDAHEQLEENLKEELDCEYIAGGGFNLFFDVDGGTEISSMQVCIACSPDSYQDIPVPEKERYTFNGWYYDKELTKKVDAINTIDITPIQKKDNNDCAIGYEDIILYSKWILND